MANKLQFPILPVPVTDGMPGGMMMTDREIQDGMVFLVGELEKQDPKLHEPLSSVTWARDLPVLTGGGWVDSVSVVDVSYATSGGSNGGVFAGEANEFPMIQADIGKEGLRTLQWGQTLKVPFIDQQKLQKIGRNLEDILNRGLHLAYDKTIDRNAYIGFTEFGTYGLLNDPNIITVMAAPATEGGEDTAWEKKTPYQILEDVNRLLRMTWEASEYDLSGMSDHILLPPKKYTYLVETEISPGSGMSILNYLLQNNLAHNQNRDLVIAPSQWCVGAGTGGKDRIAAYCNRDDRVRFHQTVPLQRLMTQASAAHVAYLTPYASQFTPVEWVYRQHAMYMDGI